MASLLVPFVGLLLSVHHCVATLPAEDYFLHVQQVGNDVHGEAMRPSIPGPRPAPIPEARPGPGAGPSVAEMPSFLAGLFKTQPKVGRPSVKSDHPCQHLGGVGISDGDSCCVTCSYTAKPNDCVRQGDLWYQTVHLDGQFQWLSAGECGNNSQSQCGDNCVTETSRQQVLVYRWRYRTEAQCSDQQYGKPWFLLAWTKFVEADINSHCKCNGLPGRLLTVPDLPGPARPDPVGHRPDRRPVNGEFAPMQ